MFHMPLTKQAGEVLLRRAAKVIFKPPNSFGAYGADLSSWWQDHTSDNQKSQNDRMYRLHLYFLVTSRKCKKDATGQPIQLS